MSFSNFEILFGILGAIIIVYNARLVILSKLNKNWIKTSGTINESQINYGFVNNNDNSNSYFYNIIYSFQVNDKVYYSDKISLGHRKIGYDNFNDVKEDDDYKKYSQKRTVEVFYFSKNPNLAVLEIDVDFSVYFLLLLGFICLIGSLVSGFNIL